MLNWWRSLNPIAAILIGLLIVSAVGATVTVLLPVLLAMVLL